MVRDPELSRSATWTELERRRRGSPDAGLVASVARGWLGARELWMSSPQGSGLVAYCAIRWDLVLHELSWRARCRSPVNRGLKGIVVPWHFTQAVSILQRQVLGFIAEQSESGTHREQRRPWRNSPSPLSSEEDGPTGTEVLVQSSRGLVQA